MKYKLRGSSPSKLRIGDIYIYPPGVENLANTWGGSSKAIRSMGALHELLSVRCRRLALCTSPVSPRHLPLYLPCRRDSLMTAGGFSCTRYEARAAGVAPFVPPALGELVMVHRDHG